MINSATAERCRFGSRRPDGRILRLAVFLFSLAFSMAAHAQSGQGILSGVVTAPDGAVVPNAEVSIRNTDTNVIIKAVTNDSGYYEVRDLNPGPYETRVEVAGFQKFVLSGIVLLADGHPSVDVTLKIGSTSETVTVTDGAPLIETQAVSIGQVITSEEMSSLPNGQTAIWLAMLSPGVQSNYAQNYQLGGSDPSWNGAGPQFGAYGRIGANEFSLDGAPNAANQRGQAINLSAEELGQTSVNITQFDAAIGHTYGIAVNQTTKAGTNDFHGGIRYRRYDLRFFGMQHFQRLNYLYSTQRDNCGANPGTFACTQDANQFGYPGTHANYGDAAIGGPVWIPGVFNGRNKLFFFVGVTAESPNIAASQTIAVPSARQKVGDFSDLATGTKPTGSVAKLFQQAGCPGSLYYGQYQVYNPYSVTIDSSGRPRRLPFCDNKIPQNLISNLPIVQMVNSALPDPNSGNVTGNNYIYEQGQHSTYRAVTNRYDYALAGSDHLYFRWTRAHFTKLTNQFLEDHLGDSFENRWVSTGALGWSHIFSSKTVIDATVGATQWTGSGFNYPNYQKYKPSSLGLPSYLDDNAGANAQFPLLSISGTQMIGNPYLAVQHHRTLAFRANLTTVQGDHTIRAGAEWRQQNVAGGGPQASSTVGGPSGQFTFDATYVQQNNGTDNTYPTTNTGLGYASFLLGIQSQSQVNYTPAKSLSNPYYSFYVGDTWRVSRRLTLVPGIRFEYEYGPTEKHNQMIVGWDPNAQLTFAPLVQQAYQAQTLSFPSLTAAQKAALPTHLDVRGGPVYAGVNGASVREWENNWRLLPRIGASYAFTPKTVLRLGAGYFFDTLNSLNENQTLDADGFNSVTGPVASSTTFGTDFKPGTSPLSNPFPITNGSRFVTPIGNALGADYYAGSSATISIYDHSRVPARSQRFQLSLEHQFRDSTVFQVAYVGSRTTNITLDGNLNNTRTYSAGYLTATAVPSNFFIGGTQPNSASNSLLGANVPNPFYIGNMGSLQTSDPLYYNLLTKSSYATSKTIQISNLVRPFPQLAALRLYKSIGTSQFQELQLNMSKRLSRGLVANLAYQKNYQKDRDYFENPFDTRPSVESSVISPPWRITASWVYTLPFGAGQPFARDGWSRTLFSGFKLSGSFESSPGALLNFSLNGSGAGPGNIFYIGDPSAIGLKKVVTNTNGVTVPTIYGFNAQAVTATSSVSNGVTTCNYSGTGFVTASSTPAGQPSCLPTNYNLRVFPVHVEGVRAQGATNWNANLGRTLRTIDRVKVEGRVDVLNLFNHQRLAGVGGAQMNPINGQFGQITADNGNGRQIIFQMLTTF